MPTACWWCLEAVFETGALEVAFFPAETSTCKRNAVLGATDELMMNVAPGAANPSLLIDIFLASASQTGPWTAPITIIMIRSHDNTNI